MTRTERYLVAYEDMRISRIGYVPKTPEAQKKSIDGYIGKLEQAEAPWTIETVRRLLKQLAAGNERANEVWVLLEQLIYLNDAHVSRLLSVARVYRDAEIEQKQRKRNRA